MTKKYQQEETVIKEVIKAYNLAYCENCTVEKGSEPPDFYFQSKGRRYGVELFELEKFYSGKAFEKQFVKTATEIVNKKQKMKSWRGYPLRAQVFNTNYAFFETNMETLKENGFRLRKAASELVELIDEKIEECIREVHKSEFIFEVDKASYSTLYKISGMVTLGLDRSGQSRNVEFMCTNGIWTNEGELKLKTQIQVENKIKLLLNWPKVDKRILVAHDNQREGYFYAYNQNWKNILSEASRDSGCSKHFESFWLWTQEGGKLNVIPIYKN